MKSANARLVLGLVLGSMVGLAVGRLLPSSGVPERGGAVAPSGGEHELSGGTSPAHEAPPPALELARPRSPAASPPNVRPAHEPADREALADAATTPPVERVAGAGVILGRVATADGRGLADVLLRAVRGGPTRRSVSPASVGVEPPPLGDLREVAREAAEELARTYEARTDAAGNYRLEGLPPDEYRVSAYKAGYVVAAVAFGDDPDSYVKPGAELDFVARPVVRLPLRLTLPEGGAPADAVVVVTPQDGDRPRATSYAWSPAEPELRLTPGSYEVYALCEGGEVAEGEPPSSLRSQTATVELQAGAAPAELVLVLRERPGIRGRVTVPKDGVSDADVRVRLLPLGNSAEFELEHLVESRSRELVQGDGDYAFLDLEPGRYAVGVTRGSGELCTHETVEVTDGAVRQDFELPPFDPSLYLSVLLVGADGAPVADPEFIFMHEGESIPNRTWPEVLNGPDGRHLVEIPPRDLDDYRAGTAGHVFSLSIKTREQGSKLVELEPGQAELTVHLAAPARLELSVPAGTTAPLVGRLSVVLRLSDAPVGRILTETAVGVDGSCTFEGLEPGEYHLTLRFEDRRGPNRAALLVIAAEELRLVSGANSASVTIPTLYSVPVRFLAEHTGAYATLAPHSEVRGVRARIGWDSRNLDAEGRARFEHIPAGRYTMRIRDRTGDLAQRDIEVPCGELELHPD